MSTKDAITNEQQPYPCQQYITRELCDLRHSMLQMQISGVRDDVKELCREFKSAIKTVMWMMLCVIGTIAAQLLQKILG